MSENPVILITGASSGIGAASARLFAANGYRVVMAARRLERLQDIEKDIVKLGGEALSVDTDLIHIDQIQALVKKTIDTCGRIDILFNNAGFGRARWLEDMDLEKDIEMQIQVNLSGLIQMTRAVLPHMIERQSGHIINMASLAAYIATPTYSIYAATKYGVRGFSNALRREVAVLGIKVSAIFPGGVKTEFAEHLDAKRKTGFTTPQALLLSSEDVARTVLSVAQRPRRTVIVPWISRFGVYFEALFPGLNDWLIERAFTKPERDL